ncbi:MAG: hypothetical protein L3K52_02650 [Candidatus Thiothrix sulfatifontis]|nr:MAG: hypothetical protein L3K52_02650 [Candidatus Thiothrix sulfatifontis]
MPTTINRKLYSELDKLLWMSIAITIDPNLPSACMKNVWCFMQAQNLQ